MATKAKVLTPTLNSPLTELVVTHTASCYYLQLVQYNLYNTVCIVQYIQSV